MCVNCRVVIHWYWCIPSINISQKTGMLHAYRDVVLLGGVKRGNNTLGVAFTDAIIDLFQAHYDYLHWTDQVTQHHYWRILK